MAGESHEPVRVDICTMKTSAGADYYVRFRCGGREVTPHMFKERYKAEYTADHYSWVFGLRSDEPDLMAYGPDSHPDTPTPQTGEGKTSRARASGIPVQGGGGA